MVDRVGPMALDRSKTLLIALAVLLQCVLLPLGGGSGEARATCGMSAGDCCCAPIPAPSDGCCKDDAPGPNGTGDDAPGCPCADSSDPVPLPPPARQGPPSGATAASAMQLGARLPDLAARSAARYAPEPRARAGPGLHLRLCIFLI